VASAAARLARLAACSLHKYYAGAWPHHSGHAKSDRLNQQAAGYKHALGSARCRHRGGGATPQATLAEVNGASVAALPDVATSVPDVATSVHAATTSGGDESHACMERS
jgi:hypothetical protein